MTFFTTSDGQAIKQNDNYDSGSGFEDIPNNTHALSAITEAKWASYEGNPDYISITHTIMKPDQYKGRKVFQKLYVNGRGNEKDDAALNRTKDKAKNMFAAIDTNAGGALQKAGVAPTDESMGLALCNKVMGVRIGRWVITKDLDTGEQLQEPKTGNNISAVCSREAITKTMAEEASKPQSTTTQAAPRPAPRPAPPRPAAQRPASQAAAPQPEPQQAADFDSFDDDIPF